MTSNPLPNETAPTPVTGSPVATAFRLPALLRQPRGLLAVAYLSLLVLAGFLAGVLAPFDPERQDLAVVLQGPSSTHLLGTDALGRDVLSRLLFGILPSLQNSLIALVVFAALGIPLGIVAGYRGGWLDAAVSRVTELVLAVPPIILVLVVLGVFSSNAEAAMVTMGVLAAPGLTRVVRGATLLVREELYVTAATVAGVHPVRIMTTHVLRRVLGPILAQATVFAGVTLAVQAALSFLGLLSSGGKPTWGGMIGDAAQVISQSSWLLFPPGVLLGLTVLAFGLLGDTIRDLTSGEVAATSAGSTWRARFAPGTTVAPTPAPADAADAEAALLTVDRLQISTDGPASLTLVDDASFTVAAGEVVAVVGESGCGKTMTALAILGLLPPGVSAGSGRVLFAGTDLRAGGSDAYRSLRGGGIGYVPQDALASLDPTHTVGSHLMEVLSLQGREPTSRRRARAVELMQQVKIPDPERVLRSYPHEISGGMAQRVNIALALAGRPRLLVADEPTTALDVTVQSEILRLLRELRDTTGMAIVIITHDWGVVADIADRAVVMYAGEVVERAEVGALFATPRFPYTAALLAAEPSRAPEGTRLPTLAGRVPPPGAWPTGCRFAGRCAFTREECTASPLPLLRVSEESVTRCIRVEDLVTEGALPR